VLSYSLSRGLRSGEIEVDHGYVATRRRQPERCLLSDARGGSSDESDASCGPNSSDMLALSQAADPSAALPAAQAAR
jgi:hypothetical protein